MRRIRLDAVEHHRRDLVFREPIVQFGLWGVMCLVVAGALARWHGAVGLPLVAAVSISALGGLLGLYFLLLLVRIARRPRWFLAFNRQRVRIKTRSALCHPLPRGEKLVIDIPMEEVVRARAGRGRKVVSKPKGGTRVRCVRFIEFQLRDPDLDETRVALRRETEKGEGFRFLDHHLVSVVGDDTLRVEWPRVFLFWRPGLDRAVSELRLLLPIEEGVVETGEEAAGAGAEPGAAGAGGALGADSRAGAASAGRGAAGGERPGVAQPRTPGAAPRTPGPARPPTGPGVGAEGKSHKAATPEPAATAASLDDRIRDLVREGKTLQAVRLARSSLGVSLEEANAYVRQLTGW